MSTTQTEWKTIDLTKETLDLSMAKSAHIENDRGEFLSLTLILRCGRTVRIRKNNYSSVIEAPVIPMITQYLVKTKEGLSATFLTREEAETAAEKSGAELTELQVIKPNSIPAINYNEIPF